MRSECMAAAPQLACCYTWKLPVTPHLRPVLFDQAHEGRSRASARLRKGNCRAEHPSMSWKAYLASREFQNLASDLADAVFAPDFASQPSPDAARPASLTFGSRGENGYASAGLMAPVLRSAAGAPPENAKTQSPRFALAA